MNQAKAFTLIELLVVITIIVVLLALLTPALDKAIYQAELLTCGTNQKVIGTSAISYSFNYRRYYPTRSAAMPTGDTNAYLQPNNLTSPVEVGYDMRPMLRDGLGLSINKNMQCALVEPVDLEETLPDEFVFGNQLLFWGWNYYKDNTNAGQGGRSLAGMKKYGDRFAWEAAAPGGSVQVKRYNLLVADFDLNRRAGGWWGSHPDRSPTHMFNFQAKRVGLFTAVTFPHTHSWWWTGENPTGNPPRGVVDLNFMYDDGSVRRLSDMRTPNVEERTDLIPNTYDGREGMYYQVPSQ